MTEPRKKRVSPSDPKLREQGWEDLDPTQLIDKASEKVREKVRESTEHLRKACAPKQHA